MTDKLDTVEKIKEFIAARGGKFSECTFTATDISEPVIVGDDNVVFPRGWTDEQRHTYLQKSVV